MPRSRTVVFFGVALVILAPERARAAGTITGISAAPNPAQVSQNVTVTLQGNGGCGSVIVNFGDNQTQTLNDVDFGDSSNTSAGPHKYAQTGTRTVTANPGSGCQGTATTTLTVKAKSVEGFQMESSELLVFFLKPHVTKQFWVVTPGSSILIGGKNFGTTPGKVHLQGQFGTRDLVDLEWYSTGIGARIPTTISGVGDHPATLQVRTSAGALSNQYPVSFIAQRQVKLLPQSAVKLISCSGDSNADACNAWTDPADSYGEFTAYDPGASISGYHYNCWGCIGDDSGADTYEISLKNGWVLEDYGKSVSVDPGEGSASGPSGFSQGSTYWKPQVQWNVSPNDGIFYKINVYVKGPKGMPFK